jgi:hypothetical protein
MAAFSSTQDRIDVFSQTLGKHSEVTGFTIVNSVIRQGSNVALAVDANAGTVTVNASGGTQLPGGSGFLFRDGNGNLSMVNP